MNTFKITDTHRERLSNIAKVSLALGANQGADLSQWCGSVFNQYQEGSCSACLTRDYLLWRQNKYGYNPVTDPDVQALYYCGRVIYGDVSTDGGNTVHDAFQAPITYGVIPSSDEAYSNDTLFTVPPVQDVVFQASNVTDLQPTTANLRASLDAGAPVGIGVQVTDTLFNPVLYNGMHIVDKGTIVPNEGHAIFVVAYKPDAKYQFLYKFQNSWDVTYGDQGFAWFTEAGLQQFLMEACTLDIPKTLQPPHPAPLPNVNNHFILTVGTDKSSYTVGEQAYVWVTLTNNGQDLIGQVVDVKISDGNDGPVPIGVPGHNGFPWGPSNAGTYTITATWQSCTATCQATFTNPQPKPTPAPTPPKPTPTPTPSGVTGTDVSKFQGSINWPELAKAVQYAFVKAVDGRTPVDPNFVTNYAGAKAAGVLRGAYQVGWPANETGAQAYAVLKALVETNGGFELPPVLDIEEASCGGQTPAQVTTFAVDWLTQSIADYGRAIVYSDENFFGSHIDVTKLPKGTLLWVANYSAEPKLNYTFWQKSDSTAEPGVTTKVDTDVFKGTLAELQALCIGGENVQHTKVVVNGHEFDAVVDGGNTYVLWTCLQTVPGFKESKVNNEFHFDTAVGVDPAKVQTAQGFMQQALNALK